jgi:hypothetical protein
MCHKRPIFSLLMTRGRIAVTDNLKKLFADKGLLFTFGVTRHVV